MALPALRGVDGVMAGAVGLAMAMWLTMALAERHTGPTSDEYWHVMRGVAALRAPDTRLNYPHPPVAQALAMLPVALSTQPHFETLRGFSTASMPKVASTWIKSNYAQGRRYLRSGRLTNAALASALLVFIVLWVRRRFDTTSAVAAGLLFATCPIVLAHGALVTNDFALGAATLLSLAAVLAYLDGGQWWRLLLAGLALALLPTVKVSGLLLLGIEALLPLVWLVGRSGAYAGPFGGAALRMLRDYALVAVIVVLAINGVYRFEHSFLTLRQLGGISYPPIPGAPPSDLDYSFLKHWPPSWPVPLPHTYLRCIAGVQGKNDAGHANMWFGHYARGGTALYFPFMLLGKTQALLVPLLALGFVLGARKILAGAGKWLLFVALLFLGVAMTSKINIGVRHVFPTLVCLLVLGGRAAHVVLGFLGTRWPSLRWPTAGLGALSLVGGVAMAFPAFVGDFNVLIGNELGRRASAIAEDWGQDSADLALELQRRNITHIAYVSRHSFGNADLLQAGIQVERLGCKGRLQGVQAAAIHLTKWVRARRCYKQLRKRAPDFTIHDNVLVFLNESKAEPQPQPLPLMPSAVPAGQPAPSAGQPDLPEDDADPDHEEPL